MAVKPDVSPAMQMGGCIYLFVLSSRELVVMARAFTSSA